MVKLSSSSTRKILYLRCLRHMSVDFLHSDKTPIKDNSGCDETKPF